MINWVGNKSLYYVKPRTKEAGRQGLVQHVEYNHGLGMFKAEQSRSEVNAKEKIKQTREFTFTLLESGLAYTQFLESKYRLHSYLSRYRVPLVSDKTFRKYANNMTIEVFDAMKKELENTYVFISLDSTPGKDRRTFISRNFIDAKGTFQSLHFGVLNVDGVLSADQYEAHLLRFFETFQICHLKIENNFDILRQSGKQTICIGGVADMGPGALQAAQSMMGSLVINGVELSLIGCDVAHGQNNVFKAAVEANELFQDLSEKGQLFAILFEVTTNYEKS